MNAVALPPTPAGPTPSPSVREAGSPPVPARAPGGPAGPKIKRPEILIEPDALAPELWRAICQECTWTCGPSTKPVLEEMAVWHRSEHRNGRIAAPIRVAAEEQECAAVELERDIRRLIASRGGAPLDEIAEGLARLGWRHP